MRAVCLGPALASQHPLLPVCVTGNQAGVHSSSPFHGRSTFGDGLVFCGILQEAETSPAQVHRPPPLAHFGCDPKAVVVETSLATYAAINAEVFPTCGEYLGCLRGPAGARVSSCQPVLTVAPVLRLPPHAEGDLPDFLACRLPGCCRNHALSPGFRYGEALHPGPPGPAPLAVCTDGPIPLIPTGGPGPGAGLFGERSTPGNIPFPCPRLAVRSPLADPTRVHTRLPGGSPPPQRSLPDLFAVSSGLDSESVCLRDSGSPCSQEAPTQDFTTFSIAVANPTSVLHKEDAIVALRCHLCLLSETSAVEAAQTLTSRRLRSSGFRWVWGRPVPSHQHEQGRKPSLRGHALGVAVASLFPVRAPFKQESSQGEAACRLVTAHARIGPLHVRVIVAYGWPANHTAAAAKNDQLFSEIAEIVSTSPVPALIGGDFNVDVTALPCWQVFRRMGYAEFFGHFRQRFGVQLPATCRQSTRHDSLLLPYIFQQLLIGGKVDTDGHLFDSHAPLIASFRMPQCNPCKQVWRKPDSWMPLHPDGALVETAYTEGRCALAQSLAACSSKDDLEAAFLAWASGVEAAVDAALHQQHAADPLRNPVGTLPRKCRGRCQYRFTKAQPFPIAAPAARGGDYAPPDEALSHRSRHKVKQVRRLQAFTRRLAATRRAGAISIAQQVSFWREWRAIDRAHGYPPSFQDWILNVASFVEYFPPPACVRLVSCADLPALPPSDWLEDVLAYVRFECDAVVRQEQASRLQFKAYCRHLDSAAGLKSAYAMLRPAPAAPFNAIPVLEKQRARLQCCAHDGWGLYRVDAPEFFRAGCPAHAGDHEAEIGSTVQDEIHGPRLWVRIPSCPLLEDTWLSQHTDASTPRELHRQFLDFWNPVWNRDCGPDTRDLEPWHDFLCSLPECPAAAAELKLELNDLQFWRKHLRSLKIKSSTGYCGFSNAELRWLPDGPLEDLVSLFRLCGLHGWPSHFGRATVAILAKVPVPLGMQHGRPITVFANLYRMWASGVARAILAQWAGWLPSGVKGSIPGRSVRDLSLSLECRIEHSLRDHRPFGGFSIDIVRCFNQLPRIPLRFLLGHLGVPSEVLHAWFDMLACCHRIPVCHGSLGPPLASTTGMPEGCPLSVVAQVAVCWLASQRELCFGAELESYVDNYTWTGGSKDALAEAICDAQSFCAVLKLPIDWSKSFAWATCNRLRSWLQGPAQDLIPKEQELRIVTCAKDLGVAFKFRRLNNLDAAQKRLTEGQRRLSVIQQSGTSLLDKARLIQTSVWPAALYGSEGRLLSPAKVGNLRTAACKALIGERPSASPFLALSAVTPRVSDPEVYLLCQSVLALQRLLQTCRGVASTWLRITVDLHCLPGRAFGPASALAGLLCRNEWTLRSDGHATGPGNNRFNIFTDAPRWIRRAIHQAWLAALPSKVVHRNGLCHVGVPAPDLTDRILRRLPAGFQLHIAQSVVGGFQSNAARATWDPLQSPLCSLCGALDHKHHRLLECPATAHLRELFHPLLTKVGEDFPHWLHCPFPTAHEDEPFLRLFWASRRLVPPQGLDHLKDCLPEHVHFFTDGSCEFPAVSAARHAAWAVIVYTGHAPPDVGADWFFWKRHQVMPPHWHVVSQGVVPGVQDINRAEVCGILQALQVKLLLQVPSATIWSDSANALRALTPPPAAASQLGGYRFCEDLLPDDLPEQLAGVQLCRVKAHQKLEVGVGETFQVAHLTALGNNLADDAAKLALKNDLPLAHETCCNVAVWREGQLEYFSLFVQYLCELTKVVVPLKAAAKAALMRDHEEAASSWVPQQWLALQPSLAVCTVRVVLPAGWDCGWCDWPSWYRHSLVSWLEALRWPTEVQADRQLAGITFLEMLVSFVAFTGRLPPARGSRDCGRQWIDLTATDGIMLPCVLRECIVAMVSHVAVMTRKTKIRVWASARHHRLWCLRVLQHEQGRKGLLLRPHLPEVNDVSEVLRDVLSSDRPGEALRDATLRRQGTGCCGVLHQSTS